MNVKLSAHALRKVLAGGFAPQAVHAAYNDPEVVYPSRRYPGQERRIAQGVCLAVDIASGVVVTMYIHNTATALRSDQTDADAVAWAQRQPTH